MRFSNTTEEASIFCFSKACDRQILTDSKILMQSMRNCKTNHKITIHMMWRSQNLWDKKHQVHKTKKLCLTKHKTFPHT